MRIGSFRRRLFVGLVVLFVASLAAFVVALVLAPPSGSLAFEGAKTLPQVGLVAVAGAIISYLAFEYQQGYTRAQARRDLLRELSGGVTTSYLDLKRSRRLMRADGLVDSGNGRSIRVPAYDRCMREVIDAELAVEGLAQQIASTEDSFREAAECVDCLRRIERLLHDVVAEYETRRPEMHDTETFALDRLPRFRALVARQTEERNDYEYGFVVVTAAVWELRRHLRSDLWTDSLRTPTGNRSRPLPPTAVEGRSTCTRRP